MRKIVEFIDREGNPYRWIALVFSVIFIRNVLESFISNGKLFIDEQFFFEYPLFYITGIFIAAFYLSIFTGKPRLSLKGAIMGSSGILLAPLLDWIIIGRFYPLSYLNFANFKDFLISGATLYANLPLFPINRGLSIGLRLEIYIFIVLIIWFTYINTRSILRSFAAGYLFNLTLLIPGAAPFLARQLHINVPAGHIVAAIFLIIFTAFWFIYNNKLTSLIVYNLRFSRLIFYGGTIFLGFIIAIHSFNKTVSAKVIFKLAIISVGYIYLWLYAVLINHKFDKLSDRISGTTNLSENLGDEKANFIALLAFISGILVVGSIGISPLKCILLFVGAAWVYSVPPLRTKRFPLISTFTLGLAALGGLLTGYSLVHGNIDGFPGDVATATLVAVTLGFCAKDLKDIAGDKSTGTMTIPVIFGYKKGKIICAVLEFLAVVSVPVITGKISVAPMVLAITTGSILGAYTILAKKFNESAALVLATAFAGAFLIFFVVK